MLQFFEPQLHLEELRSGGMIGFYYYWGCRLVGWFRNGAVVKLVVLLAESDGTDYMVEVERGVRYGRSRIERVIVYGSELGLFLYNPSEGGWENQR